MSAGPRFSHVLRRPSRKPPTHHALQRDLHQNTRSISFDRFFNALLSSGLKAPYTWDECSTKLSVLLDDPLISKALVQYNAAVSAPSTDTPNDEEEHAFCNLVNAIRLAAPFFLGELPPYPVDDLVFASTSPHPQRVSSIYANADSGVPPIPPVVALRSTAVQKGARGLKYPKKDLKWSDVLLFAEFERAPDRKERHNLEDAYAVSLDDPMDFASASEPAEKSVPVGKAADAASTAEASDLDSTGATSVALAAAGDQAETGLFTSTSKTPTKDAPVGGVHAGRELWPPTRPSSPEPERVERTKADPPKPMFVSEPGRTSYDRNGLTFIDWQFLARLEEMQSATAAQPAVLRLGAHATHVLSTTHATRMHVLGLLVKPAASDDSPPGNMGRELSLWYFDPSGVVCTEESIRIPHSQDDKDAFGRFASVIVAISSLGHEGWGVLPKSVIRLPKVTSSVAPTSQSVPGETTEVAHESVTRRRVFPPHSLEGGMRPINVLIAKGTGKGAVREELSLTVSLLKPVLGTEHGPARGLVGHHGCAYRAEIMEMKDCEIEENRAHRMFGVKFEWRSAALELKRMEEESAYTVDFLNAVLERRIIWRLSKGLRGRLCPKPQPRETTAAGAVTYDDRVLIMTVISPFSEMLAAVKTEGVDIHRMVKLMSFCVRAHRDVHAATGEHHGDVAPNHMMMQLALGISRLGHRFMRGFMNYLEIGDEYDEITRAKRTARTKAVLHMLDKAGMPVDEGVLEYA